MIGIDSLGSGNILAQQTASLHKTEGQTADFESALLRAVENNDNSALREAAVDMEAMFINQMFQAMRRTVPEAEGIFQRNQAEKIFQEMLDQETSISLAQAGGIGIADAIYEQIRRTEV